MLVVLQDVVHLRVLWLPLRQRRRPVHTQPLECAAALVACKLRASLVQFLKREVPVGLSAKATVVVAMRALGNVSLAPNVR